MIKHLRNLCTLLLLAVASMAWAGSETGTISFGSNAVKINAASVTGDDDLGNTWTITTVGTTSFTANSAYYQVGASSKPATSITFTTTLANDVKITAMSAKFGGFSGTAGTVTLKVGETEIGTGSLNATNDVTVSSTSEATGKVLTVTVTGISKGVKCYNISYTYDDGSAEELADPELAFASTSATITLGDAFTLPALTNKGDGGVTYASSNTSVATVDASTGVVEVKAAGTTTITATSAKTEAYKAGKAEFALTVENAAVVVEDGTFNFTGTESYGSGLEPSSSNEYVGDAKTWTAGNVTLITEGKYRWWYNAKGNTLRFYPADDTYAVGTMTISVPDGKVITKVTVTGGKAFTTNVGTYENGTWTGKQQTVAFTCSSSSNVETVTVEYEDGESEVEKVDIATLNGISPTTLTVGDLDEFTLDATFVEGLEEGEDYEVSWASDNTDVLEVSGSTYEAKAAGTANVTVSVTVLDDEKYNEVSKTFAVTVNEKGSDEPGKTATATFDATKDKASTGATAGEWSITKDGITIAVSSGIGGNGTEYRIYKNQTLTISSTLGKITKVEFSDATAKPITGFGDLNGFDKTSKTWEGETESITFTASGDQVRLTLINVTYEAQEGFVAAPTFSVNGGAVLEGTEVTITAAEGNTIVYTTDGTDPTESETAIGPSDGNAVTLTINEDVTVKAATLDADANMSEVVEAVFTIATPYTVSEALAVIEGLEDNGKTDNVYTKGIISEVTEVSTEYGNATYTITDGTNEIIVFRGYALNNEKFTAEDEIQVGDEVVVYGQLQKFVKNDVTTPEIAQYNYIVSLERSVTAKITAAGYATFANAQAVDFSGAEGLTVLTASYDAETNKISYAEVESKQVPAGTAVILQGASGEYKGTVVAEADALDGNDLQVNLTEDIESDGTYYCLANKSNGVGFYKVASGVAVKAGKAYLKIEQTTTDTKNFYGIGDDDATGIESLTPNPSPTGEGSIYNLAGQQVVKAQKGVYIVGGKKIVVR